MATPQLQIGAFGAIGYKVQAGGFGVPVAPSAAAGQWAMQLANTLLYDKGEKEVEVGAGSLDPTQFIVQGQSKAMGTFEVPLMGSIGINLLAFFLGVASDATNTTGVNAGLTNHVMVPKTGLRFITFEDQWSVDPTLPDGQSYRLDDCMLDQCELLSNMQTGWRLRFTVLGGKGSTSISPSTIPAYPSPADTVVYQWGHVALCTLPQSIPLKHLTNFALTMKRNPQQVFGGGNFHATDAASGRFQVSGSFDAIFATAAAASAYQDYVADTEETISVTIRTGDPNSAPLGTAPRSLSTTLTRARMLKYDKQWSVGGFTVARVPFRVTDSTNNTSIVAVNTTATPF